MPLRDKVLVNVGLAQLREMLEKVGSDPELSGIFSGRTLECLALVGDGQDMRIVPLKTVNLSGDQLRQVEKAMERIFR